jgi:hypothetical protein
MMATFVFAFLCFTFAFWPWRWSHLLNPTGKQKRATRSYCHLGQRAASEQRPSSLAFQRPDSKHCQRLLAARWREGAVEVSEI